LFGISDIEPSLGRKPYTRPPPAVKLKSPRLFWAKALPAAGPPQRAGRRALPRHRKRQGLFFLDQGADLEGAGGVEGRGALLDVLYAAFLVEDEGGAARPTFFFVEDAVFLGDFALEVAQQREGYAEVLAEALVGRVAVDTDAENLGVVGFEFGDISLIRLQFLRSTAGEGEHVEGQHSVLLAAEVSKVDRLAILVGQGEVRGEVAYFETRDRRLRRCGRLLGEIKRTQRKQDDQEKKPQRTGHGGHLSHG